MRYLEDLIGKRYGALTVLSRDPLSRKSRSLWVCRCDCGVEKSILAANLKNGTTNSCGCLRKKKIEEITQSFLKEHLYYNQDTGIFTWIKSPARMIRIGDRAGSHSSNGYISISIFKKPYMAHRLAWLYTYGKWPKDCLDHINRIKDDNRLINLREATYSQNSQNRPLQSNNTSGYTGAYWLKKLKKWRVVLAGNGKRRYIGHFNTKEEAAIAYKNAAKKEYGQFYNHQNGIIENDV